MALNQLVLSPAAQSDIKEIYQYGRTHWGKSRATQYTVCLKEQLWDLLIHPKIGILRPEFSSIMRSLVFESHIIFYRVQKEQIEIVRLLHGRQDPVRQLTDDVPGN